MADRIPLVCVLIIFMFWAVSPGYIAQNVYAASSEASSGETSTSSATSTSPGVKINVPARAPSSGPIPVKAQMLADMQIYYANNGILDKALDIVLVRRDAPGLRLVAKHDPKVWMESETPLPPSPPGTDLGNAGFIKEERNLDVLGFDARHEGAADYYVLASFAGWVTQPVPLSIEDKSCRLPAGHSITAPLSTSDVKKGILPSPVSRGVVFQIKDGTVPRVEGGLRVAVQSSKFPGEKPSAPFVTIVAVCLAPTGGLSAGSFLVEADTEGGDYIAQFSIPVTLLSSQPNPGKYLVFVFSSDECAKPVNAVF